MCVCVRGRGWGVFHIPSVFFLLPFSVMLPSIAHIDCILCAECIFWVFGSFMCICAGVLCRTTGGQIYYYPGFSARKDQEALLHDIHRNLTRNIGFDGIMLVRTSRGASCVFGWDVAGAM